MPNFASSKNIVSQKSLIILSITAFLLVAFANLVSANILSTQGINVSSFESETLKLEKQNHLLQVKVEEQSQLRGLEQIAKSQGYLRVSNIVFAPTPATVALR